MTKKCWAEKYNKCERGRSREHLISQGIFKQKTIFVEGFDWCKEKEVKIGLQSATSKILCEKHNNLLSSVDDIGIEAVKNFEELSVTQEISPTVSAAPLKGCLFERWLLKTAINVSSGCSKKIGAGMADAAPGIPSAYLLAVVFGDISFSAKMGAYFLFPSGEYKIKKGGISIMPIHKNGEIGGFLFHIRGVDIFLSLFPGHSPPKLRSLGELNIPDYLLDAEIVYRPPTIVTTTDYGSQKRMNFEWNETSQIQQNTQL